jgi:hypothetical protein
MFRGRANSSVNRGPVPVRYSADAGPSDQRRDQVIYYQYRHDRARRTLRGIDQQIAKAERAVAGIAPVKRNRFIHLSGVPTSAPPSSYQAASQRTLT